MEEAQFSGQGQIETEHVLLGLIGVQDGIAAEVFAELGIAIGPVRELVLERLGPGSGEVGGRQVPFSTLAKKVLELSLREVLALGHSHIGTEHLLLAIVRVSEGGASRILLGLGADSETIRLEVRKRVLDRVPGRADPTLRRLLMVGADLALAESRETFGVTDLLRAFAGDNEVSGVLTDLGLDLERLHKRAEGEPPAAGAAPAT